MTIFRMLCAALGVFAVAVSFATPARADLLWENSGVTPNDAYFSDPNRSPQFVADDFLLSSTSRLESVQWTGIYGNALRNDDFTIEIMVDSNPSTTVFEMSTVYDISGFQRTRTNTGLSVIGRTLFSYTADLSPYNIDLNANQQYFISIYNVTNDGHWSIAADNTSGRAIFDTDGRDSIGTFTSSLDFRLFGVAVPEPNACVLILSLGFLCCSRRQRR